MKKKFLSLIVLTLVLACMLVSCDALQIDVSISDDGYIAINDRKTQIKVNVEDDVVVDDNDYVVVNGVKTEHKVHKDPVISIIDGYIAIDGVKTEFIAGDCPHVWKTETIAPTCVVDGYDITHCDLCQKSTRHNEIPATGHVYDISYSGDSNYHWIKCTKCVAITKKAAHTAGEVEYCTICLMPMSETTGVICDVSADGIYAEVVDYVGTASKVRIAEMYNGLPVKNICDDAFKSNRSIITVIIPNSVTTIGEDAFWYCDNLTNITIPESVTTIGEHAFHGCNKLTHITIPKNLIKIGYGAFAGCSALTNITVEVGNPAYHSSGNCLIETASKTLVKGCNNSIIPIDGSVTSIGEYAFYECDELTSIIIPNGIICIDTLAFFSCDSLVSVVIPDTVISIGSQAFDYCHKLKSVTLGNGAADISTSAFENCHADLCTEYQNGKYMAQNGNPYAILLRLTNKNLSTYTIHPQTTNIANGVFKGCSRLANIIVPDSVITIGNYAFSYCDNLTSVTLGNSITTIGNYAFCDCDNLTSVTLGNSVTAIGSEAFYSCDRLVSVTFANPNGWWRTNYPNATTGTTILTAELSNSGIAATYLKQYGYYWYRSE